jgi:hypothetical protein
MPDNLQSSDAVDCAFVRFVEGGKEGRFSEFFTRRPEDGHCTVGEHLCQVPNIPFYAVDGLAG